MESDGKMVKWREMGKWLDKKRWENSWMERLENGWIERWENSGIEENDKMVGSREEKQLNKGRC